MVVESRDHEPDRTNSNYVPAIAGGLVLAGIAYGGSKFYRGIRQHNDLNTLNPKVPKPQEKIAEMANGSLQNPANKLPITQFAGTKIPVGRMPFNEYAYHAEVLQFLK